MVSVLDRFASSVGDDPTETAKHGCRFASFLLTPLLWIDGNFEFAFVFASSMFACHCWCLWSGIIRPYFYSRFRRRYATGQNGMMCCFPICFSHSLSNIPYLFPSFSSEFLSIFLFILSFSLRAFSFQWFSNIGETISAIAAPDVKPSKLHNHPRFLLAQEGGGVYPCAMGLCDHEGLSHCLFFLGRLVGLALHCVDRQATISASLAFPFFKILLGKPLDVSDAQDIQPHLIQSLRNTCNLESDQDLSALSFLLPQSFSGVPLDAELKQNGESVPVTQQNLPEYITGCLTWCLLGSPSPCAPTNSAFPFEYFLSGVHSVVPLRLLQIFTPQQVCPLLSLVIAVYCLGRVVAFSFLPSCWSFPPFSRLSFLSG